MLDIVKQTLEYIIQNQTPPLKNNLIIQNEKLLETKWSVFVTFYKNGNIIASAGNIMEIASDLVNETIASTTEALKQITNISDANTYQIRVDTLSARSVLTDKKISDLNPMTTGAFAIKKDYSKLAVILPNISANITSGNDLQKALELKIWENINEDFIVYEFTTQTFTSFA